MEATGEETIQPQHPDQPSEAGRLSRLECLGGVIVSPVKTFEHLAGRPQWFLPLIIIILYTLVSFVIPMVATMVAMAPTLMKQFGDTPSGIFSISGIVFISSFSLAIYVVVTFIVFLGMVGALYAITRIFKAQPGFYPLAATVAYAEFAPRLISICIKKFIPFLTGKGQIFMPEIPTGIAPIFSEFDVPILLEAFLARIELFHLWSFALVAIAVRFVAKVTGERAMLITLLYWAVCILAVAGVDVLQRMFESLL